MCCEFAKRAKTEIIQNRVIISDDLDRWRDSLLELPYGLLMNLKSDVYHLSALGFTEFTELKKSLKTIFPDKFSYMGILNFKQDFVRI